MTMPSLTKYPLGSLRELLYIAVPIFFFLLSSSLMSFCDRYFLSHYSLDAFKAVGVAGYLTLTFQLFCVRLTSINQVFVGRSLGENCPENIGPYTWQVIWCSLLTVLFTAPISPIIGKFYFAHTEVSTLGYTYYSIMMLGNFLFPLGAALCGFLMGIGETKALTKVVLFANLLNAGLDYVLINGVSGLCPSFGIAGAAIATLISQGVQCGILLFHFTRHPLKKLYKTMSWRFCPPLFWKIFKVGFPSAISKFYNFFIWTLSIKLVAMKGGDYLTLISFGSTIWVLMTMVNESIARGLMSLFSFFLGQNKWGLVWKSFESGVRLLLVLFFVLGIAFLFFNRQLVAVVVGTQLSRETVYFLRLGCYWLWGLFFLEGVNFFCVRLLVAMKKTGYMLRINLLLSILTGFLPFYLGFKVGSLSPDKVWVLTWISLITSTIVFFYKISKCSKESFIIAEV